MKNVILLTAMLLVLGVGSAYAVPVTINIDELYDWGRLYSYNGPVPNTYTTSNSNPAYYGVGGDTPVGTVVAADTLGVADGQEDTWGVASVATVKTIPANNIVWERTASKELTLMFQGFDDNYLSSPDFISGATTIASVGGHIKIYEDFAPNFDGTLGTAGRTSQTSYTGATEGTLVLDLAPQILPVNGSTLISDFNFLTSAGDGAMYLNIVGGTWAPLYDTNSQLYGTDFSFSFTVRDNVSPTVGDWIVRGDAGGEGNLVPEPMSMLMVGMGLLGVGVTQRKRKKTV